jgi:hypothetical protein|uniref:Uncharacterized protein n=1 Tax=Myoviridae sp. ctshb19 TaxID=2825194 RepID=A0A8S5UGG3_9CAUD|nr:MAG TPA: hypothetical protein [Myoviridae sp. ctshb19]
MISIARDVGSVAFPAFLGERVYMQEFRMEKGLPENLKRWQPTVDQMLVGVDTDGPIYLMIDQKAVKANVTHRRPGLHVDGYWHPMIQAHGGSGHGERPMPEPGHGDGSHISKSAHGGGPAPRPGHRGIAAIGGHQGHRSAYLKGRWDNPVPSWYFDINDVPEAIILATDICASRGLIGEFDGPISIGGDVTHLDLSHMQEIVMQPNRVYQGNVSFIHESLPVAFDCQRTLVRLNVPGHVVN